jgi:hypothetical protein
MEKDFLEDGLDNESIIKIVIDIQKNVKCASNDKQIEIAKKQLRQTYNTFAERYPMLFEGAFNTDFNFEHFEFMLKMRENIIKDNTSVEDASKVVGQVFFDKYMKK